MPYDAKNRKRTVYYEVICPRHGKKNNHTGQYHVMVSAPRNKRERMSGCPMCKSERNNT